MGCGKSCLKPTKVNPKIQERGSKNIIYDPNTIIDWQADTCTEKYHWWPLLDNNEEEEDAVNNLYARGGGIDKYDKLFQTKAREHQRKYHRIPPTSERSDKNWAGFCDRAASLSCLYTYPKYPVTAQLENRKVEFSPSDIEALMICAADNSVREGLSVFYGKRNNLSNEKLTTVNKKIARNLKSEPYPLELIEILKKITAEPEPFVMDIDNGSAVWNYPFDEVLVTLENTKNYEHIIPKQGITKVYKFKILSSAFPEKNIDIIGYVNVYQNFLKQRWLCDDNPDFVWKQYAKKNCWQGKCKLNPYINSYFVYRIYQQSITKENKIVKWQV